MYREIGWLAYWIGFGVLAIVTLVLILSSNKKRQVTGVVWTVFVGCSWLIYLTTGYSGLENKLLSDMDYGQMVYMAISFVPGLVVMAGGLAREYLKQTSYSDMWLQIFIAYEFVLALALGPLIGSCATLAILLLVSVVDSLFFAAVEIAKRTLVAIMATISWFSGGRID